MILAQIPRDAWMFLFFWGGVGCGCGISAFKGFQAVHLGVPSHFSFFPSFKLLKHLLESSSDLNTFDSFFNQSSIIKLSLVTIITTLLCFIYLYLHSYSKANKCYCSKHLLEISKCFQTKIANLIQLSYHTNTFYLNVLMWLLSPYH